MPDIDHALSELLHSYERSLIARIQLQEFQSWGGGMVERFKSTIAEHQALEARYLEAVMRRRPEADAQFKAMLDKAEGR